MALTGSNNAEKIWNFFKSKGFTECGIAGLMGNLKEESGLNPKNLQNSFEKKLNTTDEEYTNNVDNGSYNNFVRDSAGYGLAQWTYWSRKQNLLNFVRTRRTSIGDLESQLEFLYQELTTSYKSVFNVLKTSNSVRQASDTVLLQFEKPENQGISVQELRAKSGQEYYNFFTKQKDNVSYSRQKVVDLIESWVGKKESDGSYKFIIDIYNTQSSFPRNTRMQYGWAWCACTWSALAVKLGYNEIMPIEISCRYLIESAKRMGCWQENDSYIPLPGDAVLYDWDDDGVGDNIGNPDHVGTVTYVNRESGYMIVVEGNYSNSVKKRTLSINGKFIRGFITPKYTDNKVISKPNDITKPLKTIEEVAREVIAGKYGVGSERKRKLEEEGYKYSEVQKKVNEILNVIPEPQEQPVRKTVVATCKATKYDKSIAGKYVTTSDLYLRNDAGNNKKALVVIPKGTRVYNYGYYSEFNEIKWFYIQVIVDNTKYTGFSHSGYLSSDVSS